MGQFLHRVPLLCSSSHLTSTISRPSRHRTHSNPQSRLPHPPLTLHSHNNNNKYTSTSSLLHQPVRVLSLTYTPHLNPCNLSHEHRQSNLLQDNDFNHLPLIYACIRHIASTTSHYRNAAELRSSLVKTKTR